MTQTAKEVTSYVGFVITTKYLGPTDHHTSRVIARCERGRLQHSWDNTLSSAENHATAALALASKQEWLDRYDLICGNAEHVSGTEGYVFVLVDKPRATGATWTTYQHTLTRDGVAVANVEHIADSRLPGKTYGYAPYYTDALCKRIVVLLTEHGDGFEEARAALRTPEIES